MTVVVVEAVVVEEVIVEVVIVVWVVVVGAMPVGGYIIFRLVLVEYIVTFMLLTRSKAKLYVPGLAMLSCQVIEEFVVPYKTPFTYNRHAFEVDFVPVNVIATGCSKYDVPGLPVYVAVAKNGDT
ncbi:MAG: hypothetical protein ACP5K5_03315 [Candidatus Micrarchaeia archaeon]